MERATQKIEPILLHAERELREVIAEAAQAGDYDGVDLAREVAARVKAMLPLVVSRVASGQNGKPSSAGKNRKQASAPYKAKKGSYPRFEVRKGVLWKFGWSMSEKKEYVHKIPKDVYAQTVSAIESLTGNGVSPLTAEQIVEQTELADNPVPIYQVYVALAFLRENDIVRRDGREGYLVIPDFAERAEALWDEG